MNSWNQPNSNEPSVGTLHFKVLPGSSNDLLNGGTQTSYTDIDASALLPEGTKAILVQCKLYIVNNTTGVSYGYLILRKNGTTGTDADTYQPIIGQYTNPSINGLGRVVWGQLQVEVDSSGVFEYRIDTAGTSTAAAYIKLIGYCL